MQLAIAQGRPMPIGSKMTTPDGIVGIVMSNNTVQLQVPAGYQEKMLLQCKYISIKIFVVINYFL